MEEFCKLNWILSPQDLEHGPEFITENEIHNSYIYKHLAKNLQIDKDTHVPVKVPKQYVPGIKYDFKCKIKSKLNNFEQNHCLIALTLLQNGKRNLNPSEQKSLKIYNRLQQTIINENTKFLSFIKECFQNNKNNVKINANLRKYAETIWKEKLTRCTEYSQFYKEVDMLSYSYNDDNEQVEIIHELNVLELGTMAKFMPPNLATNFTLKMNSLPKQPLRSLNSKVPVSKDGNVEKLLEANNVDIVISSGGLKRLCNFTDVNSVWNIPVIVKNVTKCENGLIVVKKVAVIDKPLPKQTPNIEDLNQYCLKVLLKTNFCNVEAFRFPNEETSVPAFENSLNISPTVSETASNGSTTCKRKATENIDTEKDTGKEEDTFSKKIKLENKCNTRDFEKFNRLKSAKKKENIIHHNVSYRIWNLHLKNEQYGFAHKGNFQHDIKVLVRCKVDGCEIAENGALQPVTVVPKIEYFLNYGGCIATKSELVGEWVSTLFRPYSQLYRVRTDFKGEVIMVENCNLQKINNEANVHHEHKLSLGLGVLYKLFMEIRRLEPGNYLLHHVPKHGPFIALLQETHESGANVFDLYQEYEDKKCKPVPTFRPNWCPVDINLVLPRHKAFNEMPGMFKPHKQKIKTVKRKKGAQNKKKKKPGNKTKIKDETVL